MRSNNRRAAALTALTIAVLSLLSLLAGPAGATTTVTKAQRELVIVSSDLSQGGAVERALYDVVEMGGVSLGVAALGVRYNVVTVLSGPAATQSNFVSRLDQITAKTGVRAVDVIFMTHGLSDRVSFSSGGSVPITSIRDSVLTNLTVGQRAKLRMLFSTACFGSFHRTAWLAAGFKMVSGSREVYADSAASYPAFLGAWTTGGSFGVAVTAGNVAGAASGWDTIASLWAATQGYWWASQVDSFRLMSGSISLNIGTMP